MKKIAFLGECMIELNGEPFGAMQQVYGGDTLNTATYLARISHLSQSHIYYVTALGTDKISQSMQNYWQKDGINTDLVLNDPHHQPGLYLIQLDHTGERTFLYWRNQSAARYLLQHPHYDEVLSQLEKMDYLFLSGISVAILPESDRHKLISQLTMLKQKGVKIIFDSNYRPKLWGEFSEAQVYYQKLYALTDIALVTFDDEKALWQDSTPKQTLLRLAEFGIKTIVLKQGKEGVILKDTSYPALTIPAITVKNVIDTTSAGDAFNAGFLQGYLQNKSLKICCEQGNLLASIVIQHRGAIIPQEYIQPLKQQFN